jgi:hypothetical protein
MPTPRIDLRRGVVEPVVLMVSRREVEAGDVLPVVSRLHTLLSTTEAIWHYRGQAALVIDGYNDDPRELVDIGEVRAFLRDLDRQWPYWAFFFNQVDDSIKVLASCLCGSYYPGGWVSAGGRGRAMSEFDPRSLDAGHAIPACSMTSMTPLLMASCSSSGKL